MSFDIHSASLHAGLIQRARPPASGAKVVQLREAPRAPVVQRPAPMDQSLRFTAEERRESQLRPAIAPVPAPDPYTEVAARSRWSFRRRFGLTVRVGDPVRELLFHARMRSGRTTQSILHDALVQYLAMLEQGRGQR